MPSASGELSSISKLDGQLRAHAKDPISSGLALTPSCPRATGLRPARRCASSAPAACPCPSPAYLGNEERHGKDLPSRIHLNNFARPPPGRRRAHPGVPERPHELPSVQDPRAQRQDCGGPARRLLVINATGLGKDRPGSPSPDHCKIPSRTAWCGSLNYQAPWSFMHQAEAQRERRGLLIRGDGWTYFIHGWTQVIAEVFHIDITGERLAACDRLAREMRK